MALEEPKDYYVNFKTFFDNNRGVSVVRHSLSYGSKEGLYELAILKKCGGDIKWIIDYTTDITDDVLGYLMWIDVVTYMQRVASLPLVTFK